MVTADGTWQTIGDQGAEFHHIPKGSIIFNHKQTEELFKNGRVLSGGGRGRAYASGTAYAVGFARTRRTGSTTTTEQPVQQVTNNVTTTNNYYEQPAYDNSGYGNNSGYDNSYSGDSGGSSSSGGSSESSSEDEKEPQEFDFIQTALDRIKRLIDNIATAAESTFNTLAKRMDATDQQIEKTLDYIDMQQQALDKYTELANNVELPDDIKQKVWDGSMDITEYDEDTAKLIDKMQKYADAALDARDAIVSLNEEVKKLYQQKFDMVASDFDANFDLVEALVTAYEQGLDNLETNGMFASNNYYEAIAAAKQSQKIGLERELNALIEQLAAGINSGAIEEYTDAWYEMQNKINDVRESIKDLTNDMDELKVKMRELEWETFDYGLERMDALCNEAKFLQELLEFDELYDADTGKLNEKGMASLGVMGQQYNILMRQADEYRAEAERAEALMAESPYDQNVIQRREDMLEAQQKAILAANDMKKSMIELVKEGYEKEIDAIKKRTDAYTDDLDALKDLYDYQKKVKKATDEIAALEKQRRAYENDDSEETKAKLQKIVVDLQEARDDLEETEFDHAISEQKKMLDQMFDEIDQLFNERMDEQNFIIENLIDDVNMNAAEISDTLHLVTDEVGYRMSSSMENCWNVGTGKMVDVISNYNNGFTNQWTTTNSTLNEIKSYVANMRQASDVKAGVDITSTKNVTHIPASATPPAPVEEPKQEEPKPAPIGVGSTVRVDPNEPVYYDSSGAVGPYGTHQYFANDPVYVITKESNGYYLVKHHTGGGSVGWFKKSAVKAFKSGGLADFTGLAQLDGTPGRPEYVLNAKDTENFFALTEALRTITKTGPVAASVGGGYASGLTVGDINTTVNINEVEDFDDLCRKMQDSVKFDEMIKEMTLGRLNGNNSLSKHRVRF